MSCKRAARTCSVAVLGADLRYILVAVLTETPAAIGIPFERLYHALCGFYHTLCVLKAIMTGTRIDEMSHSELAHAS